MKFFRRCLPSFHFQVLNFLENENNTDVLKNILTMMQMVSKHWSTCRICIVLKKIVYPRDKFRLSSKNLVSVYMLSTSMFVVL